MKKSAATLFEAAGLADVLEPDGEAAALGRHLDLDEDERARFRQASAPVADRVRAAWVDRQARKGRGPSDHAPVIVDLDEAPDGDIGPVVPPPSRPVTTRGAKKLPQSP